MNEYLALKERHQKEVNNFPMMFAFSNKQFEEGMKELGLNPDETDKIYKFGMSGGFYRRDDSEKLKEMLDRHDQEMKEAIERDKTGDGFIYDMFSYELGNHEFVVTGDTEETLNALGLSYDDVNNDNRMIYALNKACKAQWDWYEKHG